MASATAPGKLRSLGDKIGAIALKVIVEKAVVAALPLALVVAAALRAKIPAVRDVLATRLSVTIWNLVLISFAAAIAIYSRFAHSALPAKSGAPSKPGGERSRIADTQGTRAICIRRDGKLCHLSELGYRARSEARCARRASRPRLRRVHRDTEGAGHSNYSRGPGLPIHGKRTSNTLAGPSDALSGAHILAAR